MKVLIGGTELTAKNCSPYEYQSGKRELRIWIPQSEIEYSALKAVLDEENTGEIVLTKDDGTAQTFSGYNTTYEITDKTENGVAVFYVVIKCVAEAERRALEAKAQTAALEKTVADQAALIEKMAATIENLNAQLLVVQLAAAELYEQTLPAETPEETTEEVTDTEAEYYMEKEQEAYEEMLDTETEPELEDEQEVQ